MTEQPAAPRVLLLMEEAADRLSIGRTTLYTLVKAEQIETVRVGRRRLVSETALSEFVRKASDATQ